MMVCWELPRRRVTMAPIGTWTRHRGAYSILWFRAIPLAQTDLAPLAVLGIVFHESNEGCSQSILSRCPLRRGIALYGRLRRAEQPLENVSVAISEAPTPGPTFFRDTEYAGIGTDDVYLSLPINLQPIIHYILIRYSFFAYCTRIPESFIDISPVS